MIVPDQAAIERFALLVERRLGLRFEDRKKEFLRDALRHAVNEAGLPAARCLDLLALPESRSEWRRLVPLLTVTETYFFRNPAQFSALRDAITEIALARPIRRISILSAGCASGEEPLSVAMLLQDLATARYEIAIEGIDINVGMLEKAAAGRYSAWSLRELPVELRARHFSPRGADFVLDPVIRGAVRLAERNLVEDDADFWRPGRFDIALCRNVLMYLAPEAARAAIGRIARSLAPGGLLFLGHAETLRGLSGDFDLLHSHGTFYYRRKDALDEAPADGVRAELPPDRMRPGDDDGAPDPAEPWYAVIEDAAARVRDLAVHPAPAGRGTAGGEREMAHAMALLGGEHYAEALIVLDALPGALARQSELMFLRGVLLMHRGDLVGAERICHALLARDGPSAGAHYLMALCREAGGDRRAAAAHDRHAMALDPDFAMPRLHLGLLARRAGDQAAARHELASASRLLPNEAATRLLLFGGGFGREALLGLCRAELASAGGAP